MKSFAVKEMWKFSLLQLNEMFCYGKKKAFIQLLFLRSFSICVICALVSGDSLKECLSLIEQLLILLSYYFTFWSLVENMRNDRGLINKFMLPVIGRKICKFVFQYFFDRYGDVVGMCDIIEYLYATGYSIAFYRGNERTGSSLFGRRLWT